MNIVTIRSKDGTSQGEVRIMEGRKWEAVDDIFGSKAGDVIWNGEVLLLQQLEVEQGIHGGIHLNGLDPASTGTLSGEGYKTHSKGSFPEGDLKYASGFVDD